MNSLRRGLLTLFLTGLPVTAIAQLPYDRTTFLNGFASDPTIWTRDYYDLSRTPPAYLGLYVDLRTPLGYPDVNKDSTYQGQLSTVAPFFAAGGQHVAIGHSLGSLVARGIYIHNPSGARANIRAIVALTAPHSGTFLADNAPEVTAFMADAVRRIDTGVRAAKVTLVVWSFLTAFAAIVYSPLLMGISYLFFGVGAVASAGEITNIDQFLGMVRAPAVADLKTTSPAVQTLTSYFDDGAIPRANIYGSIPFRNAVLRLAKSAQDQDYDFENTVKNRNRGLKMFKWCKYAGYATIVMSSSARKCSNAARVLQRMDDQWVKYVNGTNANGKARYVPFDGVVANERSTYPSTNGVTYNAQVNGVNHINAYKTRAGLNHVATGMIQMGMVQLGTPPTGGTGGTEEPPPCEPTPPALQCE